MDTQKTPEELEAQARADAQRAEARGRRSLKAALIFGVIAATVEMALLLWFANC
jgi:hypothetical protein